MRKVLAIFFLLIFVIPVVTVALLVLPIRAMILDRNFYAQVLSGEHLSNLIQDSPTFPLKLEMPVQLNQATLDALFAVIKTTVSPQYLDSQIKPIIDNGLNLLEGKTNTLEIKLDLKPLKSGVLVEKKDEILQVISQTIPVCTAGQQPSQTNVGICRPAGVSLESFNQTFITPALTQLLQALPDEYPLVPQTTIPLERAFFWTTFLPGLSLPNFLSLVVVIVALKALLLWFLAALIAGSSWSIRLKWLGGALIVPALIVLFLAVLIQIISSTFLINLALSRLSQVQLAPELKNSLLGLFQSITSLVAAPFFISGGITFGSAIILIVLGSIAKPKWVEPDPTIQP
jgi:hypothetical protein